MIYENISKEDQHGLHAKAGDGLRAWKRAKSLTLREECWPSDLIIKIRWFRWLWFM